MPHTPPEIRELPATRVAYLRHVGPYHEVGPTFQAMMELAGRRGLFGPDAKVLGASWDDPKEVPAAELRYDACVTVGEDFEPGDDCQVQVLGGRRYGFCVHEGAYEGLEETYDAMWKRFLADAGEAHGLGPCIEVYRNDPTSVAPEELRTEIWMPLAD